MDTCGSTGAGDGIDQDRGIDRPGAEALAGRLMAAAADLARCEATFLALLGEFDAARALRFWYEDASLASWLSRTCGIAPGTAREHVRVARALRRMPSTTAAYQAGEVSFSKVRELTRLVDTHDEAKLLPLARAATASQLARTVQAYRTHTGAQTEREARVRVRWSTDGDGLVRISAVLLPEQGAAVVAALEACADLYLHDGAQPGSTAQPGAGDPGSSAQSDVPVGPADDSGGCEVPPFDVAESFEERSRRSRVEALVEIANHWSNSHPGDRSGEDRTVVVVEVDATHLVHHDQHHQPDDQPEQQDQQHQRGVPAGTSDVQADGSVVCGGPCWTRGFGNLEPATARRMCCEAEVQAIITGLDGEPLRMGRTRRFGTRAQRRALMLRDGHCAFPACHRTRRLKIHHIVSWLDGGGTDLENLLLVCQHHHTMVHEAGITITPLTGTDQTVLGGVRWIFARPDGTVIVPEVTGHDLGVALPRLTDEYGEPLVGARYDDAVAERGRLLDQHRRDRDACRAGHAARVAAWQQVRDQNDTRARLVYPVGGGEGFNLHNCVEVLFNSHTTRHHQTTEGSSPDTLDTPRDDAA